MSEFDDKLNNILSSPADMEKILNIARSLSGSSEKSAGGANASAAEPETESAKGDAASVTSALGSIDPKMLRLMTRLLSEYNSGGNDKAALFSAIKPYLKEDRREKIDKAAEIAKMAHLARIAFSEFTGGGKDV